MIEVTCRHGIATAGVLLPILLPSVTCVPHAEIMDLWNSQLAEEKQRNAVDHGMLLIMSLLR